MIPADIRKQKIVILDFGSQYTQLIARRIREIGVYCEIYPWDLSAQTLADLSPAGIILSGGPATATEHDTPRLNNSVFELGCPVLGICYGMQVMATQFGGLVEVASHSEFGHAQVRIESPSQLFKAIEDHTLASGAAVLDVWMSHGDRVIQVPGNFTVIASTVNSPIAAIADETHKFYGVQFHPEVTHTKQGSRILKQFVCGICKCEALWKTSYIISNMVEQIQQRVGQDHVILALSGGVDSSVLAALLNQAIGKQLICVFVDSGFLRANEAEQVLATFKQHFGIKIIYVEAAQRFLQALAGVDDPEEKRKIIGHTFIDVFEEEAKQLKQVKWLAQGTIYPDVIESAQAQTKVAMAIKSHHNVGGLPATMQLQLLEPLRDLFKDEVRKVGLELGLASDIINRHPFPGPGLAVRIIGEVKQHYIQLLRQADAIFIEELRQHDLYDKVSQAFAVFLPVKSVGVVGDARQYAYVIALRAVETVDFMTAIWAHLPYDFLGRVSRRIVNEVQGVSRVTYDISSKPPATIEWE